MKSLSFARIETDFFKGKNPLKKVLAISLDLLGARHSGLLYGTDDTHMRFLPSSEWDRGVMDRFDGRGLTGMILKLFGTRIVSARGLSPVYFYKRGPEGQQEDNHGIIAYVLRNCADYYRKGINVVICPDTDRFLLASKGGYHHIPFYIYNGRRISKPKNHIKVDTRIVKHFKSSNSIYIILPDYGIMVINTADQNLLEVTNDSFVREAELRERLDVLIQLVEHSSLAYLGRLKGQKGAELLWRKEEHLRKAYAHLADNEKKYRDLYDNAPNAYFSLTPEGVIFQCNQKAIDLSGFSRDELLGKSAYDLFRDHKEAEQSLKAIWQTLKKGEAVKDLEAQMMHCSGRTVWISLSIEAIKGKDNRIIEMRVMAMDISQRKTLEKQLFHAQKMEAIGTLARGIAHDFNNVLSPVSGYAQMLLMDEGRSSDEMERLQTILDCTRHAKELVNQILTFSRQKEHQFILVKPEEAVEESMGLVRSFLPATIKIESRINRDCGYIMADPVQLHQVIMNLVTNSFHAMEESGGTLEVSLEKKMIHADALDAEGVKPGTYVCLGVADTGYGIEKETLAKIFEPYFTTKEDGKGSGIGLSVVHGIVQGHGGEIRASSVKGEGTSFKLFFPVCRNPGGERPRIAQPDQEILMGTESILLVDDDSKVAFMLTRLLERLGYKVTCFTHSLDALDMFHRNPGTFDLVITDYTMPEMDGFELAAEICNIRGDQKILLCTGLGENIDTTRDPSHCVAGYISKPVEIQPLSVLIRETLETI